VKEAFIGYDRMIRSGLINKIYEKSQNGKSAYAISKELGILKTRQKSTQSGQKQNMDLKA